MKTLDQYLKESGFEFTIVEKLILEASDKRRKLGLTQLDLARKMGTTQSVISRFENCGRKPTIEFLKRLSDALGDQLFVSVNGEKVVRITDNLIQPIKTEAKEKHISFSECVNIILQDWFEVVKIDMEPQRIIPFDQLKRSKVTKQWNSVFSQVKPVLNLVPVDEPEVARSCG